ncbi:Glycosyltransferase involved in cell wall bisynthesis [Granulicella pectinivorans]|uniref:Glycosyltransferase involved in cell wall bisynthesis n=1 Tax=Granulicella pectinivorans TaxID=474950 RepID=A0A1I6LJT2_9BACT|nr:glycosyltransferase [Granulicella pectinivorans]SFS03550.1 Glycosyltransferase involved in cell wall bisynthesis [Granulicella pectinivorans]
MRPPRVAYFPDSFHEVNGVAHTSRNFVSFAQRRDLPFLCVRASGSRPRQYLFETEGNLQTLELPRSRISIQMEKDLFFDPLFFRYASLIARTLRAFSPDVIHITGPSELGIFGAYFAWKLGIPLAASWHTNVHEYAARRLAWLTSRLHPGIDHAIESSALAATARFYGLAKVLFAPNAELCRMLEATTHRPCHLMQRGVDTVLFSPQHRTRPAGDPTIILGFVGRLSVEKNVALLPVIARELTALTHRSVRFLIIGQGAEEQSLKAALPNADFAGVLRGQALANAYANMDLLVFPSHTDTFGNVVLEALASGVPAIVTPDGGPKYIVRDHETGYIAQDADFPQSIASLLNDPPRLARMRIAARDYAETCTWDAVFERVYAAYPYPSKP